MAESPSPVPVQPRPGPIVLCIMDGVGEGAGGLDDAVATARTPNLDALKATRPWRTLRAHGAAVGLASEGDMGNSEVGHNAMGAGRVFDQGAKLVDRALHDQTAFDSDVWDRLCAAHTLHLLGLYSDGNVHSHADHVGLLIDRAVADGVKRLRLHLLTDGRDVEARSALTWVEPLEARLATERGAGRDYRIASGGGRMSITMDRYESDWSMVERGWRCHVQGIGRRFPSASEAIRTLYSEDPDTDDQRLPAFVIVENDVPVGLIESGDAVLFFNFRGDRAIEISRAFEDDDFAPFERPNRPDVFYAGIMQYDGDLQIPKNFLVSPPNIDRVVGEYLIKAGRRSFAVSETQKFGHVTYFFNGNRSGVLDSQLETYVEIPSDLAAPDTRPWMKAAEITDAAVQAISSGHYDHVRLNLPNGDMVGHTGNLEATRVALEAVDIQLARLERAVHKADGVLLITADHGNADEMYQHKAGKVKLRADGLPEPKPSHTLNPVPFILVDPRDELMLTELPDAGLASIGATLLELCGVPAPDDYLPALVRTR